MAPATSRYGARMTNRPGHLLGRALFVAALACGAPGVHAQAQPFACLGAQEGDRFTAKPKAGDAVQAVAIGRSRRAVVFSNTAYNEPCDWLPFARELAAGGYQVVLWKYASSGLEQIGELSAVIAETRRRGAEKVVLAGGSRGGCLSMMTSSEPGVEADGIAILSCAAVFNRRNPTETAPWAAKVKVPLLHITGEGDSIPTLDEARKEFAAYPIADKKLVIVPRTGAHGDQLLSAPDSAASTKAELADFFQRVTR